MFARKKRQRFDLFQLVVFGDTACRVLDWVPYEPGGFCMYTLGQPAVNGHDEQVWFRHVGEFEITGADLTNTTELWR